MKSRAGFLLLLASGGALAGNGLLDIGYGAESEGFGGADTAVVEDTAALMINPARLTAIHGRRFDIAMQPAMYLGNRHEDALGNDVAPDNPLTALFGGGYAQRIGDSAFTAGIGLFVQGGAGLVYENLQTAFGTRDQLSSLFASARVVPGIGWKLSEQLSLGLSLGVNYSLARQQFFPDTSMNTPDVQFAGFRADGMDGFSLGGRVGLHYQPDAQWAFALAYSPRTPIKLQNGTLTANYEAMGLGRVRYAKASIDGLGFASDLSLGAVWSPLPRWRIAGKFAWLDWSQSMRRSTLHASRPDDPDAPPSLAFTSILHWRDQYVVALGTSWQWTPGTQLRAGINYGRSPVDNQYLTPTLAMIADSAVTAGVSHRLSPHWQFDLATQYQRPRRARYTNEAAPFGPSVERWEGGTLLLALSRIW